MEYDNLVEYLDPKWKFVIRKEPRMTLTTKPGVLRKQKKRPSLQLNVKLKHTATYSTISSTMKPCGDER